MANSPYNKGASRIDMGSISKLCLEAVAEGAVVYLKTDFNHVGLAEAAAEDRDHFVAMNKTSAAEETVGCQMAGVAMVLLATTEAVTIGDWLIVANSSGHVKAHTTEDSCMAIGRAMRTQTAGATAELIPVRLNWQRFGDFAP